MHEPILYTVNQASDMLQISRSTMYRLLSSGAIESFTIQGCRRIRPSALAKYIDAQQRISREKQVKFR